MSPVDSAVGRLGGRAALAILALVQSAAVFGQVHNERIYLSGRGRSDPVPWQFRISSGQRAGEWSTIGVPSQWEHQGFGAYAYGFEESSSEEVGSYALRFSVPSEWTGDRVALVFEGVMTDCSVSLNGEPLLPAHQGGFTRFSYAVEDVLRFGEENLLLVRVAERSSEPSVNRAERDADYWVFGGIYRPVYLESSPSTSISSLRIDARHDGDLALSVALSGAVRGELEGRVVEWRSGREVARFTAAVEGEEVELRQAIPGVSAWSAEDPFLYQLELVLHDDSGPVHRRVERFGFRSFEIDPGRGLLVNGERVLLKGVNRHSFWPSSGRALDATINRQDAELIKALNANAVRTSHYPPDREFLAVCDEIGLYVLDELPGWHDAYATEIGRTLVEEMVTRDHNHPSVIAWTNGNEGGWNRALDSEFSRWDLQARPVLHPGESFGGIDATHYRDWAEMTEALDSRSWRNRWRGLFSPLPLVMPTEALHGLYDGGHGAGLEDFWGLLRETPRGGGIFLWAFLDEAALRVDEENRLDTRGNFAPDGLVGPWRQREGSFWAVRSLWAPVRVAMAGVSSRALELQLENRFDHIGLGGCRFVWEWLRLPRQAEGGEVVLARDTAPGPDIDVGATGSLTIPFPPADEGEGFLALRLRALDRDGRELGVWVFPVEDIEPAPSRRSEAKLLARQAGGSLFLESGDLVVELDPDAGAVVELSRGGRVLPLRGGHSAAEEGRPVSRVERIDEQDRKGVRFHYGGGDLLTTTYSVDGSEWLSVEWEIEVKQESAVVGLTFFYPEEGVLGARWLGVGPFRVWGNRLGGGVLGVWEKEWNDTATGIQWQYPEFKGFHAGVRWMSLRGREGSLGLRLQEGLYLGLFRPSFAQGMGGDGEPLARHTEADQPRGDLSFLHSISSMGTKFHSAEELGPQGRARLAAGVYRGRIWLRVEDEESR